MYNVILTRKNLDFLLNIIKTSFSLLVTDEYFGFPVPCTPK